MLALSAALSHADQPVRVLDRLGGALQRIEPAADGSLGVVSADELDVVTRGPAGWRAQPVAVTAPPRMFAAAWLSGGRWWLVRQDPVDEANTLWDLKLLGPVQPGGGKQRQAPVAATLARRRQSILGDQVIHPSRGGPWLVRMVGEQAEDRSALRSFEGRGIPDPRFDGAAAIALSGLAPVAVTAAAAGGWWVSATDGPSPHARATLVALGPDGSLSGTVGRVALDLSGSGLPDAALPSVRHLLDDGTGTLWATVLLRDSRRVAAAPPRNELRAFSTATGQRRPESEPPLPLMQELWSDAVASERSWSGFVRNAAVPTLCVAAWRPSAHDWVLRCIARREGAWHPVGEPGLLPDVSSVGDVVADPHDPRQLLVGADAGGRGVALYAWRP